MTRVFQSPQTAAAWQRCPVCEGRGTVPIGFYPPHGWSVSTAGQVCRTCGGRGMVRP